LKAPAPQFSKINPDEVRAAAGSRAAGREQLERADCHRERQRKPLLARKKVELGAKERDEALKQVDELARIACCERLFIDAEGRTGGDNRGSFLRFFSLQVGAESAQQRRQ